ncbi:MAG: transketolase [Syntrophales bacterium]|jgi:transketolase|nr:transketolase [Syntrophales bacterium]MDY0043214.1 transketolase [Syntrophales bacterium]
MKNAENSLIRESIDTIRFLAVDAIEKANSGHPGLPMGCAAMAYTLWMNHLRHSPADPNWFNRDRFILSAGHGSMLLYALLYLTGYNISLDDITQFRMLNSKTPGHPEYGCTPGVEVTTGPLGQGVANAVGMAIAEAYLSARYNRHGYPVVDHFTYVIAGDGDLMEGISAEACSLAGHLKLGKLIMLYDDNRICLAGSTALSFTEDVGKRFEAYGWQVLTVDDGEDIEAVDRAISEAKEERTRPSLIAVRTIIGCGAPKKQGTCNAHGAPLGTEEAAACKISLHWPGESPFHVSEDVLAFTRRAVENGKALQTTWNSLMDEYRSVHADLATELERIVKGDLPQGWEEAIPSFQDSDKTMATRKASEEVMQALGKLMPELLGGTADLNPSTLAWVKGAGDFESPSLLSEGVQGSVGGPWGYEGRNIHFGVREHAMGAIANGMALHGGITPYVGTFFTFSDYMKPSMRLAALMGINVIYVFSHDSIGVGEDGPTHQPVEQLMNLRCTPNIMVIRPADANETAEAWRQVLTRREGPAALILSRQALPLFDRNRYSSARNLKRGGYILWESHPDHLPEIIIIGTGSECALALAAGEELGKKGIAARVVSLPCWELFDAQSSEYRDSVLPPRITARVSVEAGITLGWEHYLGFEGKAIGMQDFGKSAPAPMLYDYFGITVEKIVQTAHNLLGE